MLPGLYLLLFCLLGGSRFGLISCILSGESVLYFVGSSGIKRRKEKQMEEKQKLFEVEKEKELYESKVSFFTEIAHEVRTP